MLTSARAITLDLDDTLWDIGRVIARAERELRAWLSVHYPEIPKQFSTERATELRDEVIAANPDRAHDFRFIRKSVYHNMAEYCGYPATLVDRATAVFDRWRNTVDFFDDAVPALERLASHFPLIALTNGNADLDRVGIAHLFEATVTAVAAGAPKPHAPIFDMAAQVAGVDHASIIHVGDDPDLDVAGARLAGLRTVWVNRRQRHWPQHIVPPDLEVTELLALADVLVVEARP